MRYYRRNLIDKLLIIGNSDSMHVGNHFYQAAKNLGMSVALADVKEAYDALWPTIKFYWYFLNKRPPLLKQFSLKVLDICIRFKPNWILSTGICPVNADCLQKIGDLNIKRVNFLTDDPWNPAHYAKWFLGSLLQYDYIFSPRQANLDDLCKHGCTNVRYLPFAFAPDVHYPESSEQNHEVDIMFVGGADQDRLPFMHALVENGFKLALYGAYWHRFSKLKNFHYGIIEEYKIRQATAAAKVGLCLARKANRDGHVMRTFELAAMGACMLVEDTKEHRSFFCAEGLYVLYFKTIEEMVSKLKWLLQNPTERQRLSQAVYKKITHEPNRYQDRLLLIQKSLSL